MDENTDQSGPIPAIHYRPKPAAATKGRSIRQVSPDEVVSRAVTMLPAKPFPFLRELVRDLPGDLTGDESLPEALIIMQGPRPRRFPGVAIRRLGFIGFPSDQKPQSLVE